MKKARVLHRKALKPEDADILCGVWWPSWSTCNKQQPTWQFPLNKLFLPFRRNKVYASWQLDKASISVNRGSHFQVHFVWQVWDGQLSPAFKSIRLKAFGGWKFDRGTTKLHARILRGKGVQKKKPNMFTAGSSTSATFVLPVYILYHHSISLLFMCTNPLRPHPFFGRAPQLPRGAAEVAPLAPSARGGTERLHRWGSPVSYRIWLMGNGFLIGK